MKKTAFYLLLAISAIITFSACSSDNTPATVPDNLVADIVSVNEITESTATFLKMEKNDSPIATLTVTNAEDLGLSYYPLKTGDRVMISYVPQSGVRYVSDFITLYQLQTIPAPETITDDINKYPDWDLPSFSVDNLWRTGTYINLYCRMTYLSSPNFKVIYDKKTINNSHPDIYLTYDFYSTPESVEKSFVTSFDISTIWLKPTCHGVNIHLKNKENVQTITINKTALKPVE